MMTVLVAWLWQGVVIGLVTDLLLRFSPRLNAATRYAIYWMALAAVLALPLAHIFLTPAGSGLIAPVADVSGEQPFVLPTPPDWLIACAAGIWLGTILLGAARIVGGFGYVARLKRRARPLDRWTAQSLRHWTQSPARRRAELRVSRDISGACALGLTGSPVILLSERLVTSLDADGLDQIVIHEQAHLSRCDDWASVAQATVRAFFGLHPAVRLLGMRLDLEREAACDDVVVVRTGGATRYARCLAKAVEAMPRESQLLAALSLQATGSGCLLKRVERLLDSRVQRHPRLQLAITAAGLVALGSAAFAAPGARLVIMADTMALLPAVHGEPAHRAFDWTSRAVSFRESRETDAQVVTEAASGTITDPSRPEPAAPVPAHVDVPPAAAPHEPSAAPVQDPERADNGPLASRALTLTLASAPGRPADDDRGSIWSAPGDAGAAMGDGLARMGTAAGARSKRAGAAIGGFFSRAGKAVADSF